MLGASPQWPDNQSPQSLTTSVTNFSVTRGLKLNQWRQALGYKSPERSMQQTVTIQADPQIQMLCQLFVVSANAFCSHDDEFRVWTISSPFAIYTKVTKPEHETPLPAPFPLCARCAAVFSKEVFWVSEGISQRFLERVAQGEFTFEFRFRSGQTAQEKLVLVMSWVPFGSQLLSPVSITSSPSFSQASVSADFLAALDEANLNELQRLYPIMGSNYPIWQTKNTLTYSVHKHLTPNNSQFPTLENDSRYDLVDWLITQGENVNFKAPNCSTPLHIASESGALDIVCLLVHHGADVFAPTHGFYYPIHSALKERQYHIAAYLAGLMRSDEQRVSTIFQDRNKFRIMDKHHIGLFEEAISYLELSQAVAQSQLQHEDAMEDN